MKILLLQPNSHKPRGTKKLLTKFQIFPSLTLEQLAGNTPANHEVKTLFESREKINFNSDAELIGISVVTPEAPHTYEIADEFRRRGKTVVLGGWHPSALPLEAKEHADSVVIGEADLTWQKLLQDLKDGRLKSFYRNNSPVDLTKISPPYRTPINGFQFNAGVQASRGCPMGCEFCGVSNSPFGRICRHRPIDQVIDEFKKIKLKNLYFYDPSLTVNPEFTKKLFFAMKNLNKKFICFGNMNILAKDNELLRLARDAGCQSWFIGFESISQKTIDQLGKNSNKVENYKSSIKKIHDYGMAVIGAFIFGFDNDTIDVFDNTLEMVQNLNIDTPTFTVLTPYPGTPLFERLKKENRILTYDWSKYTEAGNVVFQPKNMTPEALLEGHKKITNELKSLRSCMNRVIKFKKLSNFYRVIFR